MGHFAAAGRNAGCDSEAKPPRLPMAMYNEQKSYLGKRFEFKYVLDRETATRVETYIQRIGLDLDPYSTQGYYRVNSLYFETRNFHDYFEKDASLRDRKKMRARIYQDRWLDPIPFVNLEIKLKRGVQIDKERIRISEADWKRLMEHHFSPLSVPDVRVSEADQEAFRRFAYLYIKQGYRPYVVVSYLRRAYIGDFTSPVRITFDKDIRACRFADIAHGSMMVPITSSAVVLEVKFNHKLPWWFTNMVRTFNLSRTDFSKYLISAETINRLTSIPIPK
jgi:hypothetical protein